MPFSSKESQKTPRTSRIARQKSPRVWRGPVALVTGAAGIIGPAICRALKDDGWRVAAADLSAVDFELHRRVRGRRVDADVCLEGDISSAGCCRDLVVEAEKRLGQISLLINNATANGALYSLEELSPEICQRLVNTDLLAPLYLTQAAVASLSATQGHIINISSIRVNQIQPGTLMYSSLKAALEKMTEAMALELAPHGIRANAIRVGAVMGDSFLRSTLRTLPPAVARRLRNAVMKSRYQQREPDGKVKRFGLPEDIAAVVAFLASPRASFVNGAVVPVDGAYSLLGDPFAGKNDPIVERWSRDPQGELRRWLRAVKTPK